MLAKHHLVILRPYLPGTQALAHRQPLAAPVDHHGEQFAQASHHTHEA
jgi:hypothetical protein